MLRHLRSTKETVDSESVYCGLFLDLFRNDIMIV